MANCIAVKQSISIVAVIGQVVPLKRRGHWYQGRCPFHDDHHPSLVVWPATGTWKCMTCSPKRDDVIGFVAQWRQCSTAEAIQWLRASYAVTQVPSDPAPRQRSLGSTAIAPLADRDATYQALLAAWGVSDAHRAALKRRGLTDRIIRTVGFATVVPGRAPVVPRREGVPGFARNGPYWDVVGPRGLAIPVRDETGAIQAIHVRTERTGSGKYRWLSTPTRPGGAASGAPVHVARGVDDVVWITEGPLKAIVAQSRLGHTVLGVPGVSAWSSAVEIVERLHPRRVVLAFDYDTAPETARQVKEQTDRLTDALAAIGYAPHRAVWSGFKGLDDALVAKAPVDVVAV